MTQRELADALGITDQTVSNVERGQRPSLDVALAFARFYGVAAEHLFAPSVSTAEVVVEREDRASAGLSAPSSGVLASIAADDTAVPDPVAKLSEASR